MTAGWDQGDLAAGDAGWRALRSIGSTADLYRGLADICGPVADLADRAVDRLEVELDDAGRRRVINGAAADAMNHVLWSVVGAIRKELTRPEPIPFAPPAAGAWCRQRWLPRPATRRMKARVSPEWDGAWHVFSGDLAAPRMDGPFLNDRIGRARCGASLRFRLGPTTTSDVVIADQRPTVDLCLRCVAIADGPAAAEAIRVERRRRSLRVAR